MYVVLSNKMCHNHLQYVHNNDLYNVLSYIRKYVVRFLYVFYSVSLGSTLLLERTSHVAGFVFGVIGQ
jgi:hypothetical protein